MPPMVCCKKTWSVGSDDFVISSVIGIIFHTIWLGGLIAFSIVVFAGRDCFPEGIRKQLVFAFIFSQIALQALIIISEGLIGLISSRGTISNATPREILPHFLRFRAILYFLEILGCAFGCYVAWSPYIQDNIDCERANSVSQAIEAYVISVIVILTIIAVLFMVYFDPLGLQTPSLLRELHVTHNEDETDGDIVVEVKKVQRKKFGGKTIKVDSKKVGKRLYSASSRKQWTRRVRVLCCCAGGHNSRSKVHALEDIAHAMATMFDGVDIVLSDFVAAMMLVHRDQKEQMKRMLHNCDLGAQLRTITYYHMDDDQFVPGYVKHATHAKIDYYLPDIRLQLKEIRHYLKFALGIYGWPIHIYMNPLVGSVCLCAHLKCRALHRRAKDFTHDNCCLANTSALQLRSRLTNDDVIYVSYKNEVHLPPFCLCYDHPQKAVVLSIRGSMSLRDALTDMNMTMRRVKVSSEFYKNRVMKVHSGMYKAAENIRSAVDTTLEDLLFSETGRASGYKLIITGHSLGAGVAAILAVLYKERYSNLHCYAFSPPGSLFTLPLVEYSKSFITTIIYGNDIVPRLTFRGLLYLKRNMTHLIDICELPKHAILCPSLFSCCYGKYHHHSNPGLKDADIYNHSTESGILKTPVDEHGLPPQPNIPPQLDIPQHNGKHVADITGSALAVKKCFDKWKVKTKESTLHKFVEKMYTVEQTPAFVPGRVLYIRETGKRIRRRFWNVFGEKEVCAVWMPNEEFSHIIVDTGIFDHHMPDSIQGAVERLYQHQIVGKDRLPEIKTDSLQKNASSPRFRAKTVASSVDSAPRKKKLDGTKSVPPVQYFRNNTEPGFLAIPEGVCVLDDGPEPTCPVDEASITVDNQVEVLVHLQLDNDGKVVAEQETQNESYL